MILSASFFPVSEDAFNEWFENFWIAFEANWRTWSFSDADREAIAGAWICWRAVYGRPVTDKTSLRSAAETAILGAINHILSAGPANIVDWPALGFKTMPEPSASGSPSLGLDFEKGGVVLTWTENMHPVWSLIEIQSRSPGGEWEEVAKVSTNAAPWPHPSAAPPRQYRARWVASSGTFGPWGAIGTLTQAAA